MIRTRRWKYFVTDPAAKTRRVPSKRWRRTQARIGTLHVQSASIRRDVLHKATTTLAQQHQVIWVEPSTRSACARAGVPANAA